MQVWQKIKVERRYRVGAGQTVGSPESGGGVLEERFLKCGDQGSSTERKHVVLINTVRGFGGVQAGEGRGSR